MDIHVQVRARRRELGFTQREAAERAKITLNTWSDLERGVRRPRGSTLRAVEHALDVDPGSLTARAPATNVPNAEMTLPAMSVASCGEEASAVRMSLVEATLRTSRRSVVPSRSSLPVLMTSMRKA